MTRATGSRPTGVGSHSLATITASHTESDRLAPAAVRQIENPRHEVFLSAASVWEMAIKRRLGTLPLPEPVAAYVARRLKSDAVGELPVSAGHAAGVEVDPLVLAYGSPAVDVRRTQT